MDKDCIPSMFLDLDQTDHHHDLFQLYSSTNPRLEHTNSFELLRDDAFLVDVSHEDVPNKSDCNRGQRKASTSFADHDQNPAGSCCDPKKKKIMHRDSERQRRQEMATLYRALRSLLPLQYLKGKRSICDQMHVAVNYIKHLQNKIQELNERRDELHRLSNSSTCRSSTSCAISECSPSDPDSIVTVRPCLEGVEVVVSSVSLSGVMQFLIGEGLSIVNCISTTINERFLHTLQCQVISGGRSIDLFELQQKLMKYQLTIPS